MFLTDNELAEVEGFAKRSGLDQIHRICGELRAVRRAYIEQCLINGQLRNQLKALEPRKPNTLDPQDRFAAQIDFITDWSSNASPKP